MAEETSKLTPNQEKAIIALLSNSTLDRAADAVGVDKTTLIRWLKLPHFVTAYREARRDVVTHSIATLQKATTKAVQVLLDVAESPESPAAARVSAARVILDTSLRAVEIEDLAARVEALEGLAKPQEAKVASAALISKIGNLEAEWMPKPVRHSMVDAALLERGQWRNFLGAYFPYATRCPFGVRHVRLWEWFEALEPGTRPRPRVEIWPRGGGKSSTTELGVVRVGTRLTRRFCLYVSETQKQAEKHVQAISNKFLELGEGRATSKYGLSMGWKADLLRTDRGFNVLAIGLDVAARGVKLDDFRPDLIVFDDVDARHDTAETVQKKVETITESILPSGASDCAILVVQNLIHRDSIVATLAAGRADFLLNREASEVEPALRGMQFEPITREDGTRGYRITAGTPTWEGQSVETCEHQLNEWGRSAFLREAQQEVDLTEDGLWQRQRDIEPFRISPVQKVECLRKVPELKVIGVGIDPSASSTGDEAGIIVAGVADVNGVLHGYVLDDYSMQGSPKAWATEAVRAFNRHKANNMVAEANNGGEMVSAVIETVPGAPNVKLVHAARGKQTRAEPVQKLYEDGRVHHAREFIELEREMCTWKPGDPSPNRMDALVWILTKLMVKSSGGTFAYDYTQ